MNCTGLKAHPVVCFCLSCTCFRCFWSVFRMKKVARKCGFSFTPKKRYSVFPVPFRFIYSEINVSAVQTAFSFLAEKFSGLAVISPDFVRAHFVNTGPTIS